MGSNFDEHSEKASFHPGSEDFNDASQYVSVRGVTEIGVLPFPHPVTANRHQTFRVCKDGDGSGVRQRILQGQAGGGKFSPARGSPLRASSNLAASTSLSVVVIEPRSHALVAVQSVGGADGAWEVGATYEAGLRSRPIGVLHSVRSHVQRIFKRLGAEELFQGKYTPA